jgi:glycosyltransferase involved in cell wall biosynthesis
MIVRDEERVLARCLSSLRGVYDEICIVDTGSTDGTIDIAKQFGARVRTFFHCNGPDGQIRDFALARNASLEMAKGDFLLRIDADEVLDPGGAQRLRQHARRATVAGIRVSMRWGKLRWLSVRLIKNDPQHRFTGRIHEYVSLRGKASTDPRIVIRNRPNKAGKEGSKERTIRIGEEILREHPKDMRTLYYLGNALMNAGRLDEAIARYTEYLALGGNFLCERHMAAYEIAVCHLLRNDWQLAIDAGFRALSIDPRYAGTHCVLGDAYAALGEIATARQWFRSALSMKAPPPSGHLFIDPDAYGRYPRRRIRECDAVLAQCDPERE